jgi:hypothetical protein
MLENSCPCDAWRRVVLNPEPNRCHIRNNVSALGRQTLRPSALICQCSVVWSPGPPVRMVRICCVGVAKIYVGSLGLFGITDYPFLWCQLKEQIIGVNVPHLP